MPRRRAAARESPRSVQEERSEAEEAYYQAVGDYKHGSIVRIKLKNFLTYTDVEVFPKPRLNMVVGPNGTGKSSILCAICLGLGGEPKLLGRADGVGDFVQTGQDEAYIEVELANENGNNPVITRTIIKDEDYEKNNKTKTVFTWDGDAISAKAVRERVTGDYQIQIDNLCTFLPQEKVGSISGYDSKNLLLETEKTLSANKQLFHEHQQLIRLQRELHGGDDQVESLHHRLEQLNTDLNRMEREVQRMERLRQDQEMAELLEKKILWLRFDRARDEVEELKSEKERKLVPYNEAHAELQPLEQALDEAKEKKEAADTEYQTNDNQVTSHKKDMDRQKEKYESHDDKIESLLSELNNLENERATLRMKAEDVRDKVKELENLIKTRPASIEDLKAEKDRLLKEDNALKPEYKQSGERLLDVENKKKDLKSEFDAAKKKVAKLNDDKANRIQNFFSHNPDAKRAYDWVAANRAQFRKPVLGPIACEVTPKSKNDASYLEQHVANNVLRSFVVQDKTDYDLLYREVRVQHDIPINITMIERISEPKARMYSDQKMAMLRRDHGVIGYLDESFEAPEVVMEALRSTSAVHKVLVGSNETQVSMDDRNLGEILSQSEREGGAPQGYSIFTTEGSKSFKYQASVSTYSGQVNLRVDDVRLAKWLKSGVSEDVKLQAENELEAKRAELEEIEPVWREAKEEHEDILRRQQEARSNVNDVREQIRVSEKLITKLKTSRKKLEDLENQLANDDEGEKSHMIDELNQRIRNSLRALKLHSESYKKMLEAMISASVARLKKEAALIEVRTCKEQYEDRAAEVRRLEEQVVAVQQKYKRKKSEAREMMKEAKDTAPLEDEDGNDTELKARLEDPDGLGRLDSVEHAEAALEEVNQRIRNVHEDRNVFRIYEQKQAEKEETERELNRLTTAKADKRREMVALAEPWETRLEKILTRVDKRFSRYMQELGCVGEVRLRKGDATAEEEEASYADYGVEIKVSFREGVEPTVLTAEVQSGGERSVSTIMYLMAMQDLMVAPFRCVDEINQGLDDRNERLVFKRIVENSTKPPGEEGPTDHCGQYWLITPKLLPNLVDMEVEAMNVLCIFNGPFNLKRPRYWNVESILGLRKRTRLHDEDEDIEADD